MNPKYQADIRFLQPVIEAYNIGLFDNLPVRVRNALESLSYFDNIEQKEVVQYVELKQRKKYTRKPKL